jgi:pimeloyl-ACP methyl ester carboxylesterase
MAGLVDRFRVLRPEFPGSGESSDPGPGAPPLEVAELVAHTIAVADHAGAEQFHVAGWSLGAVVAAGVAAAVPDRVRALTLVCGWARTDARMRFTFDLWRRLIDTSPELFARYAYADGLTAAGFEALTIEGVEMLLPTMSVAPGSARQIDLDTRVDITVDLARITAPTIVIGGLEDRWVDIAHSRYLAEHIAGAELVELACGHLVPAEHADDVTRMLLEHHGAH